jgi:hypothetical protein
MQTLQQALDTLSSIIDQAEQIHAEHNARREVARDLSAAERTTLFPQIEGSEMMALKPLWPEIQGACKRMRSFLETLSDAELLALEDKISTLDDRYEELPHPGGASLVDKIQG